MTYSEFFCLATGRPPYPYQEQFAEANLLFHLVQAPTGAGKTATAILGWLWRYLHSGKPTPRRLVYCLPMRVLVEQSEREARTWLSNLDLAENVAVHVLMGGVEKDEWFLHPERPAILIGTQDMLLSRALNRGYGASRFHWPIDFGLLNNDAIWVFDEPQLMGSGVSTSAQLAGLRASLNTFGDCPSIWMSATLEPNWLDTIDFVGRFPAEPLKLSDLDYDPQRPLYKRMTAVKTLQALGVAPTRDYKEVAAAVVAKHVKGTQTLVVLNTVDRAKLVYAAIKKNKHAPDDVMLLHSRFRPKERAALNDQLTKPATDRIIVATQVVEAGVDISARTLVTELAPWASIVQRIGRCNRTGDDGPGQVFWIDLDPDKQAAPYEASDLQFARTHLQKLEGGDVSPKALDEFKRDQKIALPFTHTHVLRRRDLLDLFDTTPDLSGNDIDIQRFVRGDKEDIDVQVFWRELGSDRPEAIEPDRRELCKVPIGGITEFLKKRDKPVGFFWDHLDEEWQLIREPKREVRPGMTILLPTTAGGYSILLGWDAESTAAVIPDEPDIPQQADGTSSDPNSTGSGPELTIAAHTQNVCRVLDEMLKPLAHLPGDWLKHLAKAARWHDAGKAHDAFQHGMRNANSALGPATLWAKSGSNKRLKHGRKYFRHELASALAVLQNQLPFAVAYLVAAHHGKVRLSIRSMPNEKPPADPATPYALGVHHGDRLPTVDLADETSQELTLDLSPMRLGGEASWTAAALALRDALGPFRLAYLEALLRAADVRASQQEKEGKHHA